MSRASVLLQVHSFDKMLIGSLCPSDDSEVVDSSEQLMGSSDCFVHARPLEHSAVLIPTVNAGGYFSSSIEQTGIIPKAYDILYCTICLLLYSALLKKYTQLCFRCPTLLAIMLEPLAHIDD